MAQTKVHIEVYVFETKKEQQTHKQKQKDKRTKEQIRRAFGPRRVRSRTFVCFEEDRARNCVSPGGVPDQSTRAFAWRTPSRLLLKIDLFFNLSFERFWLDVGPQVGPKID